MIRSQTETKVNQGQFVLFDVQRPSKHDSVYFHTANMLKETVDKNIDIIQDYFEYRNIEVITKVGDRLDYLTDRGLAYCIKASQIEGLKDRLKS